VWPSPTTAATLSSARLLGGKRFRFPAPALTNEPCRQGQSSSTYQGAIQVFDCTSGPATCVFNSYGSTADGGNPGTEMLGFAVSATMITYPAAGIFIVAGAPNHKGTSSGNNGDYSGSYTWYFYAVSSGAITASYYHSGEFGTSSGTLGAYGGHTVTTYPGFAGFAAGTSYWDSGEEGAGAWLYYCPSSLTTSSSTDTTGGCTVRQRLAPTSAGMYHYSSVAVPN